MNIGHLYEMQKALDARIIEEKGLDGQDLLPNTILALQVEIGELANEWRGFKHWSNDQEPREKLLEEYVDCLHFFLSIAHQIGLSEVILPDNESLGGSTVDILIELIHSIGMIHVYAEELEQYHFKTAFYFFINLGQQRFGFSWEQITAAYVSKNNVNHERQSNGY